MSKIIKSTSTPIQTTSLSRMMGSTRTARKRSKVRDVTTDKQAREVASRISFHLSKTYPGHLWAVNVEQGVVEIKNCFTSTTMGFRLKVTDLDVDFKNVTMAAGEILERYRLKRGEINMVEVSEAKRNVRGVMAHES